MDSHEIRQISKYELCVMTKYRSFFRKTKHQISNQRCSANPLRLEYNEVINQLLAQLQYRHCLHTFFLRIFSHTIHLVMIIQYNGGYYQKFGVSYLARVYFVRKIICNLGFI